MATKSLYLKKKRGLKWWLVRLFFAFLFIIAMCIGYILFLGSSAKSKLIAENPAPGTLIDMGGYNMHINCIGNGSPTVIMEAGAGDFSLTWSAVQPEISLFTRVCTYDRSGFGWSDINEDLPRTSLTMVKELEKLLLNAGIDDSYILVGHSFGGINVRLFAELNPEKVVGIVLVDSLYERQSSDTQKLYKEIYEYVLNEYGVVSVLKTLGLLALSPSEIPDQGLPSEALRQYRSVLATSNHVESMIAELSSMEEGLEQVRQEKIKSLGDTPLIILSAKHTAIPFLSDIQNEQLSRDWEAMQLELTAQSSNSQRVIASESGHYIQLDQPYLVIDAVNNIIKMTR